MEITMENPKPLTDLQIELTRKLAERVVDGMDIADLCTYAIEQLTLSYEEYTEEQLVNEVKEYYPDLLED
jgi:hypothetical protein